MKQEKYVISVDWLQIYAVSTVDTILHPGKKYIGKCATYTVKEMDIQTAMFKNVVQVMIGQLPCAVIQYAPRSSKLFDKMVLLKLDNRILYSAGYVGMLYDIMQVLGLRYKGITRLDLCYDCIKYKNGRNPSKFINSFIAERGITAHNVRKKGSEEFTCHGKKPRGGEAKINYIRFGSPQSRVAAYIYNKSQELSEVHDKPWIREVWKEAGLPTEEGDIFRAEISIKAEGMDILNMSTGDIFRLSPDYVDCQEKIEMLFNIYADKYLCFLLDGGQKRKKDFKRIELFESSQEYNIKPIRINKSADTGRIEKIAYNVLNRISEQYTDMADSKINAIAETMVFLNEVSSKKRELIMSEKKESYLKHLKAKEFYNEMDIRIFESWHENNELRKTLAGL